MNTPPSLPAAFPARPEAVHATLDERIAMAESRLVAREQGLRRGADALLQRLRRATEPRRLVWPLLGGVSSLLIVGWAWRRIGGVRHTHGSASAAPERVRAASSGRSDVPWVRAAALAWPLLPAAWRARVGPGTASLVVAVGLPLAEQLFKRGLHAPLPTVDDVNPARFAGTWYEIARLPTAFEPACGGPRSVTYTPQGAGFDMVQCCGAMGEQPERATRGTARALPGSGGARLEMSWLPAWLRGVPFAWAERWIVHLDSDYSVALLGSPRRDFLSILCRQPSLEPQALQALVERARESGFTVERLRYSAAA
jgi:apolipoprotein D and lipocalin family protein